MCYILLEQQWVTNLSNTYEGKINKIEIEILIRSFLEFFIAKLILLCDKKNTLWIITSLGIYVAKKWGKKLLSDRVGVFSLSVEF